MRGALCLCAVLFGLGIVDVAAAQAPEPEPPPAPLLDAKESELHAKLASALYKSGNFLEAATELNLAYALAPQPVYLFNIAQAYRKALRAPAAKIYYQRFLEVGPNHALAQEARGYMIDMDPCMRKSRAILPGYKARQRSLIATAQAPRRVSSCRRGHTMATPGDRRWAK